MPHLASTRGILVQEYAVGCGSRPSVASGRGTAAGRTAAPGGLYISLTQLGDKGHF